MYPDPPEDDDKDRDPCMKYDRYANVCKPLPNNGQCEQGYAKLFGACFDTDAILDHETPEECQADPLCREYRERYPSQPVEPVEPVTPPCETVEPGTLCEDEGELRHQFVVIWKSWWIIDVRHDSSQHNQYTQIMEE